MGLAHGSSCRPGEGSVARAARRRRLHSTSITIRHSRTRRLLALITLVAAVFLFAGGCSQHNPNQNVTHVIGLQHQPSPKIVVVHPLPGRFTFRIHMFSITNQDDPIEDIAPDKYGGTWLALGSRLVHIQTDSHITNVFLPDRSKQMFSWSPLCLAVGHDGTIWGAYVYTISSPITGFFELPPHGEMSALDYQSTSIEQGATASVRPDGSAWFVLPGSERIALWRPPKPVRYFQLRTGAILYKTRPDPSGDLWYQTTDGKFGGINAEGTHLQRDVGFYFPYDFAFGADGALWLAQARSGHRFIVKVSNKNSAVQYLLRANKGDVPVTLVRPRSDGLTWFWQSDNRAGLLSSAGWYDSVALPKSMQLSTLGLNLAAVSSDKSLWIVGTSSCGCIAHISVEENRAQPRS